MTKKQQIVGADAGKLALIELLRSRGSNQEKTGPLARVVRELSRKTPWFGQKGVCYNLRRRKPNQFWLIFLAGFIVGNYNLPHSRA